MRAVFQHQPEVAHVYLGSKRHMMRRIFSDANEPFWRSAKQVELGVIAPGAFRTYIRRQFDRTGRVDRPRRVGGDPRASRAGTPTRPRSCATSRGRRRRPSERCDEPRVAAALDKVLRSEHAHFSLLWDRASGGAAAAAGRAGARAGPAAVGRLPPPPQPPGRLDGAAGGRDARARRAGGARPRRGPDRRAVPRRVARCATPRDIVGHGLHLARRRAHDPVRPRAGGGGGRRARRPRLRAADDARARRASLPAVVEAAGVRARRRPGPASTSSPASCSVDGRRPTASWRSAAGG